MSGAMPSACIRRNIATSTAPRAGWATSVRGQRLARAGLVVLAVGGAREDEAAEPAASPKRLAKASRSTRVGFGQRLGADREVQRQLAQHAGVLRALAGEEEGELAGRLGAHAVMNAGRQRPGVAAEAGQCQAELGHAGRPRSLATIASVSPPGAPARSPGWRRGRAGRRRAWRSRSRAQVGEPAGAGRRESAAPEQQLGGPALGRRRRRRRRGTRPRTPPARRGSWCRRSRRR